MNIYTYIHVCIYDFSLKFKSLNHHGVILNIEKGKEKKDNDNIAKLQVLTNHIVCKLGLV